VAAVVACAGHGGGFAALDQRVALRYEIPGMEPQETAAYLKHHLALAGR